MLKMSSNNIKPSPRKFQDSAAAMMRNMGPMLSKARSLSFRKLLMPNVEVASRANHQTELLKWQQEMFHRVLNTMCLVQDNLLDASELVTVREHIIRTLVTAHSDGEWAEYTRDKLLFLQDLYQSRCISEEDYHKAKQPILERLAEQGAQVGSQDFEFDSNELKNAVDSRLAAAAAAAAATAPSPEGTTAMEIEVASQAVTAESASAKKKTPIKHVMDAMSRLTTPSSKKKLELSYFDDKQSREEAKPARVPHALDFLRPPDCPTRDPPDTPLLNQREDAFESPLFKHSSAGSTTRTPFPQLSSDTTDLLPQLSSLTLNDFESPPSVPSSPAPATQSKPAPLARSNSLTPSKLSFTPRSALTPSKSPLGLTHSASRRYPITASPSGKPERTLSRKFSGLLRGWQKVEVEPEVDSDDELYEATDQRVTPKKSVWQKLDLRAGGGGSSSLTKGAGADDDDDFGKEISEKDPLLSAIEDYPADKVSSKFIHGQGPNVKKLKKKVDVRAAPTNFFIDQVLGDNIKTELDRMRKEMAPSNPGNQTFTNEQIDAIATRLPVDRNELMRFFPKAWCDKYGDVVLEVVHKEFKGHVSEMDGLRKASKEKRKSRLRSKGRSENDENRKSTDSCQTTESNTQSPKKQPTALQRSTSTKPQVTRVYTTEGSDFKAASIHERTHSDFSTVSHPSSPPGGRARRGVGYEELDVKLGAEILRMPFRNFNESTRYS